MPVPSFREIPMPSSREMPVPSFREIHMPSSMEMPVPSFREIPMPSSREMPVPSFREIPVPHSEIPVPSFSSHSLHSEPMTGFQVLALVGIRKLMDYFPSVFSQTHLYWLGKYETKNC
jgi:hypothetical protein